ncbi:DUF4362 domain-containing protein [Paenibacillus psychroresistens]|uniref:DUF4362 domain-containing protein n=1 Tax=Paenibacillus psychroresistens TaxID=1778678 RepID=A0A6B8RKD2_9BACL|nr:DUF4362 domain-containing protein [Paenibacillus psychroresistens]QGQ96499.1 DUF4362 domain-containing protein [Paenibacillus psychroresistens]
MNKVIKVFLIIICTVSLVSCSRSYNPAKATKRGDIVDIHGKVTNEARLDIFINSVKDKKMDKIRITRYTIEGDPLYFDFTYDGQTIKYKYDNSNDKFGSSDVRSTVCKDFTKTEEAKMINYKLEGCSGKNADIGAGFGFSINKE